ncbi:MAG: UPF0149 family protein [Wohlfahrtiimonas sp.]
MSDEILYSEYQDVLVGINPSEAQGMLISYICAHPNEAILLWIKELSRLTNDGIKEGDLLVALYKDTVQSLNDLNFTFSPLLPEGDVYQKIEALQQCAEGLIYGIGINHLKLEGDAYEFMNDLIEFSHTTFEVEDEMNEEETEQDFEEVLEFVRMGILLLYHETLHTQGKSE